VNNVSQVTCCVLTKSLSFEPGPQPEGVHWNGQSYIFCLTHCTPKDEIIVAQPSNYDPSTAPSELPENVHSFLGGATDMPDDFVIGCWSAFSQTIWTYEQDRSSAGKDTKMFRKFGLDHLLCVCIRAVCVLAEYLLPLQPHVYSSHQPRCAQIRAV
jgi:hypothetical protein